MSAIAAAVTPRPSKARNVLLNLAQWAVLIAIQALAALALDGWLSIAMWVVVARNGLIVVTAIYGLSSIAAEAINAEKAKR